MIEVTDATFNEQVVTASHNQPVVVDLWAPWCGPCKTLTPILEKVITETDGAVVGAKVNIDENPEVARAMQVQSIPLVVAFKDGQPVDAFLGAQGEPMVRDFVSKLLPETELIAGAEPEVAPVGEATDPSAEGTDGESPAEKPPVEFDLAEVEAELEKLLGTVKANEADRERFVELLEMLGPEHPSTAPWRKRLSTTLY